MPAVETPLYLLDTNILIHAVRGNISWQKIKSACDPLMATPRPVYSFVSEAELLSFAEQQNWSIPKREQAAFLLTYFDRLSIENTDTLDAYVLIDAYSRRVSSGSIHMGKNDLWIAATAYVVGATIITTDRDFDHLHGDLLQRILIM